MSAPLRLRPLGWALAVGALASAAAIAVAVLRGPAPPGTLDERVAAVASTLRCPVCQNLSVADSPSRLAAEMREEISRDLRDGNSPEDIRAEFVAAYGEWVLLEPPKRGLNLVAWLAPALLLGGGLVGVALALRGWRRGPSESVSRAAVAGGRITAADRELLGRALAELDAEERT